MKTILEIDDDKYTCHCFVCLFYLLFHCVLSFCCCGTVC